MFNMLRLVATSSTLFFTTAVSASTSAPSVAVNESAVVLLVGMSATEQDVANHAVALFVEAGLDLPHVEIRRHHDTEGCNGHEGLHRVSGATSVIDICTGSDPAYTGRTILHELGHAWSWHNLTPEHRDAFQQLRGWTQWLDADLAWEQNGAEQAAEIIVWALSDHPVPVVKIAHNTCTDLLAGYVALTGLTPLHGYTSLCEEHTTSHVS